MFNSRHPGPPARVEGGVRAAVDDTISVAAVASAAAVTSASEFQKRRSDAQASQTRARDLPHHLKICQTAARDPKGTTGALKATFWDQKATTWRPLGPTLGPLGVHLAHLGPTLADFGPTWGTLGASIYRKTPDQPPQRTLC